MAEPKRGRHGFSFSPELGQKMRQLRRAAGLTIAEMARRLGRDRRHGSHLSKLERGAIRRVADMYFEEFELWRDRVFRKLPASPGPSPDEDARATP